jgi:PPE-repeat protein
MGVRFAKIGYGRFQGPLRASKKGDWVDARIAASAAYAAWLVTNDADMTARARHVTQAFGFGPRLTTMDEFLLGGPG